MAKKEGFCTQCGSLITIDDSKEKVNCIFCGGENITKDALALNEDNETREQLQKKAQEEAKETAAKAQKDKKNRPAVKKDSSKPAIRKTEEITVINPLPKKVILKMVAGFVMFFVIIAAILVPMILSRNSNRAAMDERIQTALPVEVTDHTFLYMNNRELLVVTGEEINEGKALDIFSGYLNLYSSQYSVDAGDVRQKLKLSVYSPEGVYYCAYSGDELLCRFETADPTPTPEPTTAIN